MTTALDLVEPLIEKWERFEPRPYLCPANRWTIGFGTTRYPNGVKVGPNDKPITIETARLYSQISAARVYTSLKPLVRITLGLHRWAALIDLGYNIGVGAHDGIKGDLADSTLLAKLNRQDFDGAREQFRVWNKIRDKDGKHVVSQGLVNRRNDEIALWNTPDAAA